MLQELVVERDKNKSLTERVCTSVFSAYGFALTNIVAWPKKMRLPTVLSLVIGLKCFTIKFYVYMPDTMCLVTLVSPSTIWIHFLLCLVSKAIDILYLLS